MKSEPDTYGIAHLEREPGPAMWEGCRNYTVRNAFRDLFSVGDLALFAHSNANPAGLAGVMRIANAAYPDPTQWDPDSEYYDPKSPREAPRWLAIDVEHVETFPRVLSLAEMRVDPVLATMETLRRGNRLSVTSVTPEQWDRALTLARG